MEQSGCPENGGWLCVYIILWPPPPPPPPGHCVSLQTLGPVVHCHGSPGSRWSLLLCLWRDGPLAAAQDIPISIPLTRWPLVTLALPLLSWCPCSCLLSLTCCHISQMKTSRGSCLDHDVGVDYESTSILKWVQQFLHYHLMWFR